MCRKGEGAPSGKRLGLGRTKRLPRVTWRNMNSHLLAISQVSAGGSRRQVQAGDEKGLA